jgi:excinuclease UvrABC ATPase subunit
MEKSHVNIQIRNARENNLKSIDVDIPLRQFVVIAGISGSGKSPLTLRRINIPKPTHKQRNRDQHLRFVLR